MFPTVFNNVSNPICKKEVNNKKLITLGDNVLNNTKFGLNRTINYIEFIKLLYLNY